MKISQNAKVFEKASIISTADFLALAPSIGPKKKPPNRLPRYATDSRALKVATASVRREVVVPVEVPWYPMEKHFTSLESFLCPRKPS
jgi:hypothetical protein